MFNVIVDLFDALNHFLNNFSLNWNSQYLINTKPLPPQGR